ncbi:hypothetical protein UlMin_024759 [Ulmus minor]
MGLFDGSPISPDKGYLRKDLSQIDESWAAAHFDSLPHVVHILTSKDREGEVRFLKEQSDIVEEVVDEVVHAYHSGFNKAIQNYSQILRLFNESTESIAILKDDLADAKRRLSACNKQLHQLWYRSVTLRHIISLLNQIEGIAEVCLFVHLHTQSLLLKLLNMLVLNIIETLAQFFELAPSVLIVFLFIVLLKRWGIFHGIIIFFSSSINENDDEVPTTTSVELSMNNSQPLSQRTRLLKGDNQFGVHGDGLYRPSSIDGGSSFDGHDEDGALDAHDEVRVNGGEGYSKEVKIVPRQMPTWLLYSTPNEFLETMQKSDAPLHVKYLQTMVECLCMLRKVAAAGAMICQRLRPTIHEVITSKIKAHAKLVNSSRYGVGQTARSVIPGLQFMKGHLESYQLPKQKHQNGISLARTLLAVSPVSHVMAPTGKAHAAAKELLDSILDTVRIFENHVVVGEILELKSAPSDMNTPKSMSIDGNWNLDSEASQVTGGYSIGFSLTILQSECQQLICEILRATPEAASADAAVQIARLASKVPSKGKMDGAEDGLTFAFRFTDASISIPNQGVYLIHQGWSKKGPIIQEGYGSATLLPSKAYILQHPYTGMFFRFMIFSFHAYKVASILPMKYSQLGNDGLLAFDVILGMDFLAKYNATIESVSKWPTPTTVIKICSFLGLARYYRRFMEGVSSIAAPLIALTRKGKKYEWTERCKKSFQELKNRLTNGILNLKGRVCIPNDPKLRTQILTEAHATPYSVHPGATKMYKDLKENFWWFVDNKFLIMALRNTRRKEKKMEQTTALPETAQPTKTKKTSSSCSTPLPETATVASWLAGWLVYNSPNLPSVADPSPQNPNSFNLLAQAPFYIFALSPSQPCLSLLDSLQNVLISQTLKHTYIPPMRNYKIGQKIPQAMLSTYHQHITREIPPTSLAFGVHKPHNQIPASYQTLVDDRSTLLPEF